MTPNSATIGDWQRTCSGLDRLERELLLAHHLGCSRSHIIATPDLPLSANQETRLDSDAARLLAGEPLAYITGFREFWTHTLKVTPAVLIPRPETETLVEQALARIRAGDKVLDLGTGSGAIAIAIAAATTTQVTAVDISETALTLARENAAAAGTAIDLMKSDWLARVQGRYDMIVANPPYIAAADPHLVALAFEPRQALVSGPAGMDALHTIIGGAWPHLTDGAWLLVEHGYDQAIPVAEGFQAAGFTGIEMVRDLGGQPRVTLGQRSGDLP